MFAKPVSCDILLCMNIYDVSLKIEEGMLVYPGDPLYTRKTFAALDKEDGANVSVYTFGSHTGTHLDAAEHVLGNGQTLDALPPQRLVAQARVFDFRGHAVLDEALLKEENYDGVENAFFKTDNSARIHSERDFYEDYVAFSEDGARFLASRIGLVALDYLSVDRFKTSGHPAHRAFMAEDVIIVEGVDLHDVPAGDYTMFVGVLNVAAADGAPARIFLVAE